MNPTAILDAVHGPWAYAVLGLSAFAESAAFAAAIALVAVTVLARRRREAVSP